MDPDVRTIPEEGSGGTDMAAQVAVLMAERDRLAAEKAELQDRLLRRQAEFENSASAPSGTVREFLQFAGMEVVRELLPILDDFERALQTKWPTSVTPRRGADLPAAVRNLQETRPGADGYGGTDVRSKSAPGGGTVETEEAGDQSILGEFQKGYNFKGKLLRPAMVKVAVRPPERANP